MYLQYSTRDQIINSTTKTGEAAGNVILVSLENLDVRTSLRCNPVIHHVASQTALCLYTLKLHMRSSIL